MIILSLLKRPPRVTTVPWREVLAVTILATAVVLASSFSALAIRRRKIPIVLILSIRRLFQEAFIKLQILYA